MLRRTLSVGLLAATLCYALPSSAQTELSKPSRPQGQQQTTTPTATSTATTTTVSSPTGDINSYGYVDLGLSVKWAICNVGASSPSDYGNYYVWSATRTKSEYTEDNSVTYGKTMGSIAGNATYDAARANWGGTWRLPTASEIGELVYNCTHEWTTLNGVNGYKVTGPNGNSIFLPAAGRRLGSLLSGEGDNGYYWSATPSEDSSRDAYELDFSSARFDRYREGCYYGQSVRPVAE